MRVGPVRSDWVISHTHVLGRCGQRIVYTYRKQPHTPAGDTPIVYNDYENDIMLKNI